MKNHEHSKIAVVGAGAVGSDFAYAALINGVAREIALVNRTVEKCEGEAMDLNHAMPFCSPTRITAGGYELCAGADVVVITAGASQDEGMTRLDLTQQNARIIREVVREIMKHNENPILLMVTNPVDVLTYVALRESGLPPQRVIGSGTVLDSARFRYLLASQCGVDPRNVHSHVVGEHGDTETLLWSRVNMGGSGLDEFCENCNRSCRASFREDLAADVRGAAYEIIKAKGATSYGIGMSLVRIVEAILFNQYSVLTVSSHVAEYGGVRDVCFSLPSVVCREGVVNTLELEPEDSEREAIVKSASVLRETLDSIGYQGG